MGYNLQNAYHKPRQQHLGWGMSKSLPLNSNAKVKRKKVK